ncbi:hypothetical protein K9L27_01405 [Candidatus Gracilibacteria bacterium]|nr:hypothetical protein [Candidatus Gracilibacteria bacterium]
MKNNETATGLNQDQSLGIVEKVKNIFNKKDTYDGTQHYFKTAVRNVLMNSTNAEVDLAKRIYENPEMSIGEEDPELVQSLVEKGWVTKDLKSLTIAGVTIIEGNYPFK